MLGERLFRLFGDSGEFVVTKIFETIGPSLIEDFLGLKAHRNALAKKESESKSKKPPSGKVQSK